MNYPVWYLPETGGGLLIALIAILHVFVSHFAVGGGLYLIYAEKKALREKSQALLDFTRDHARFFLLVTMVFGSITGVGIWFIKPSETRLYFVSNQKVHPSGQQIFPQLLRCRAFAVAYYGFMPGASTCEKLC
jgi:hypothetical protein